MNIIFLTVVASLIGLCIGSFINVVVFRTKSKDPFWTGRSKCRTCLVPIVPRDLVPVISYFNLRGRCRSCKEVVAWQYPMVELTVGVLFGLFFVRAAMFYGFPEFVDGTEWALLFFRDAILACFLVVIFIYDFRYSYILDRFSIPAMIIALLANLYLGADPLNLLLGGFLIGGFFAIQFIVSRGRWIGGGDIRMGMLMGFLLGVEQGLLALFLAYILGSIIGVILILAKKRKLDGHVPFGTFLAIATVITLFFGEDLLSWYLAFF
jgi:prepilin signal peptidase PulO-like enzyme (type II secretory pathway)